MKTLLRKVLRLRPDLGINFYIIDFLFRRILRQNSKVKWAIHHTSTVRIPEKLIVGKHTYPGDSPNVYIAAHSGIEIGDYTNIGPNVSIISANYDLHDNDIIIETEPIKIGKFCWFGSGAAVMPGVSLGDFTMVGAGAIVAKSFPEGYCVIAGNPAKVIKLLDKEKCIAVAKRKSK